jgi:curved DNA-binding protein CbpA
MKPLAELDHYEVLEIPRDAGSEDIERAYRLIRSAYAEDSVAAYSLFEGHDAEALRERIDIAYRALSDAELRRHYDVSLKGELSAVQPALAFEPQDEADSPAAPRPAAAPQLPGFDDVEVEEEESIWDGARLRRARLLRGVELEQVSEVTKINTKYLTCLEEERFEELPPPVYVRGFVMAYARCLRLDGARVAASYMQRCEAQQGSHRRGRRLGGLS